MSRTVAGTYHPPGSSKSAAARLELAADGESVRIVGDDGATRATLRQGEGSLSSHVAGVPRRLELPDGALFVTADSAGLERLTAFRRGWWTFPDLARLERPGVLLFAIGAIAIVTLVALIRVGLPSLASELAARTPASISRASGSGTLAWLDRTVFKETRLTPERRQQIKADFNSLALVSGLTSQPKLHFRRGRILGPNAFALMGGHIVVTDELVKFVKDRQEIAAILAHELSHAQHRHVEQKLWRVAGVGLVLMLVFGDAETLVEEIVTMSSGIVELSHSREHEAEADRTAVDMMSAAGLDPSALASGLNKFARLCGNGCKGGWLSTHPGLGERVQAICASLPRTRTVRPVCR